MGSLLETKIGRVTRLAKILMVLGMIMVAAGSLDDDQSDWASRAADALHTAGTGMVITGAAGLIITPFAAAAHGKRTMDDGREKPG